MTTDEIRVLLLDDDPDLVDLARTFVEREHDGMVVETETDPDTALDRIDGEAFDCVVTDYKMGTMDGLDLLRAIRADSPDLPVLFFTGKGSEEIAAEAINLGVTDYIRKETGTEQFHILGNRIASLVAGQRAMRDAAAADARIRQVYERITVAFVALDESFRFSYLNTQAEQLLEREADDLLGESAFEVLPGGEETDLADAVHTAMEAQAETHADAELDLEGDHVHVELHVYPSSDGVSVFIEDVTDEIHREAELEELRTELEITEQQFRTLRQKLSRPPSPFR